MFIPEKWKLMNLQMNICINFICNSPKLEPPKCPSMGKWLNKLWYFCTMEYYPVIKWNRLVLHATTWINLKGIMLEKVNNHLKKLHSNQHNTVIFFRLKKNKKIVLYGILEMAKLQKTTQIYMCWNCREQDMYVHIKQKSLRSVDCASVKTSLYCFLKYPVRL